MKIGKKLYVGFGSILVIPDAVRRTPSPAAFRPGRRLSTALKSVRTIEAVRYQIMLNRNNLNNFLLSGDPRDEENVERGLTNVFESLRQG